MMTIITLHELVEQEGGTAGGDGEGKEEGGGKECGSERTTLLL